MHGVEVLVLFHRPHFPTIVRTESNACRKPVDRSRDAPLYSLLCKGRGYSHESTVRIDCVCHGAAVHTVDLTCSHIGARAVHTDRKQQAGLRCALEVWIRGWSI